MVNNEQEKDLSYGADAIAAAKLKKARPIFDLSKAWNEVIEEQAQELFGSKGEKPKKPQSTRFD